MRTSSAACPRMSRLPTGRLRFVLPTALGRRLWIDLHDTGLSSSFTSGTLLSQLTSGHSRKRDEAMLVCCSVQALGSKNVAICE